MPLTPLQRRVVGTLRAFRSKHDYVGGGAALNQRWPRLSDDMDIFGDHESLPHGPGAELEALRDAGFSVDVTTHDEYMVEAIVKEYGFETKVQWVNDHETSCRFFPAMDDDELGFRLHPADAAVNKVLCSARRHSAARDAVDLLSIVTRYCPLGPLIWALPGKDPSLSPNAALLRIRNIAFGYSDQEIRAVRMEDGASITRQKVRDVLDPALKEAAAYCDEHAPDTHLGHLLVGPDDVPAPATAATLSRGLHRAIAVTSFGSALKFEARYR